MAAQSYGITETGAVLIAAGDLAVVIFRAKKQATGPDGKLDATKLGQAVATQLMLNPTALNDLEAAAGNIGDLPKELKDLSLAEVFQLLTVAGSLGSTKAARSLPVHGRYRRSLAQ